MKGELIVIEGVDGSGKATQTELLRKELSVEGRAVKALSFPRYDDPSGALVKQMLAGAYGTDPGALSPYTSSLFFSVDRAASYMDDWGKFYEEGGIIVSDRYTTSNMLHQGAKLSGADRDAYMAWLEDLEYGKIGLPKPDLVIYLTLSPAVSRTLRERRAEASGAKLDIHEQDAEYMSKCADAGLEIARRYGWTVVACDDGEQIFSIDTIHSLVSARVHALLDRPAEAPSGRQVGLDFLKRFIREDGVGPVESPVFQRFRALWTAYWLLQERPCGTDEYSAELDELYLFAGRCGYPVLSNWGTQGEFREAMSALLIR